MKLSEGRHSSDRLEEKTDEAVRRQVEFGQVRGKIDCSCPKGDRVWTALKKNQLKLSERPFK